MEFYSRLELRVLDKELDLEEVLRDFRRKEPDNEIFEIFHPCDTVKQKVNKWYEYELGIKKLSEHYPEVVFALYGRDEKPFKIWVNYYKNGLIQEGKSKITYTEFNEISLMPIVRVMNEGDVNLITLNMSVLKKTSDLYLKLLKFSMPFDVNFYNLQIGFNLCLFKDILEVEAPSESVELSVRNIYHHEDDSFTFTFYKNNMNHRELIAFLELLHETYSDIFFKVGYESRKKGSNELYVGYYAWLIGYGIKNDEIAVSEGIMVPPVLHQILSNFTNIMPLIQQLHKHYIGERNISIL